MLGELWQRVRNTDWIIFFATFFLVGIGLAVIYGISINPVSPDVQLFRKQLVFTILGIALFFTLSGVNYRLWHIYSKSLYLVGVLLLVIVRFFGTTIRGTTGWFVFGPFSIQPVEFAKIALLIFLAKYFSDHAREFFRWRHTILTGVATAVYATLVLLQPDLGSAIVIIGTWFFLLLAVGIPRRHLMTLLVVFAAVALIGWFFVLKSYQKDRINVFLNPQTDQQGIGYNVRQSIIAVGSGRIFGRGFGLGSQSQLKFLPEASTDFIFAALAEEYGLIGVLLLFGCFAALQYRLFYIAQKTTDNFAAFFALGTAALLVVQSFINIGMNVGIAPVTGTPLPLVSSGGSSLLAFYITFGIISGIVADNRSFTNA